MDRLLTLKSSALKSSLAEDLEKAFEKIRTSTLRLSKNQECMEDFFAEATNIADNIEDISDSNLFNNSHEVDLLQLDKFQQILTANQSFSNLEDSTKMFIENDDDVYPLVKCDDETVTKMYDSNESCYEFDCYVSDIEKETLPLNDDDMMQALEESDDEDEKTLPIELEERATTLKRKRSDDNEEQRSVKKKVKLLQQFYY